MKTAAFVAALISLVAWLEPRLGFLVGYLAFFLSFLEYRKRPSRLVYASGVMGIVGFVLSLIHLIVTVSIMQ